jgi:hypothetical protein
MRTIAIVQSSYIPWRGYFDLIRASDSFVFLDDVQYTRRDWRSRNKIKTSSGVHWLTVPVRSKGRYHQRIMDVEISDPSWQAKHWRSIELAYRKAPAFDEYGEAVRGLFERAKIESALSAVNAVLIAGLCSILEIATPLARSTDILALESLDAASPSERLAMLVEAAGGTCYLSGPSARSYLEAAPFRRRGIAVAFVDYSGYRPYPQIHGSFEGGVSVIDLIFNTGSAAGDYLIDLRASARSLA